MVSRAPDPACGTLRVGNGAGFWGDNLDAPYLLARDGQLDVLTLEYLAELTMAILSHLRSKDPTAGYVTDFSGLVLTGRVADASLTLGPAAAHFGWSWDEWTKLAGASTAGHLIECGAQATGGLWHGWTELADFAGIGYPIAEIGDDGCFAITKPAGTGGLVSVGTGTEQ